MEARRCQYLDRGETIGGRVKRLRRHGITID
jgi:hypothetical protein